jgi:signal peptidase
MGFRWSRTLTTSLATAGVLLSMLVVTMSALPYVRAHDTCLLSVQTGSMEPILRPGDAVVVERTSPRRLRVGDIISYRSPRSQRLVITHRLINVDPASHRLITRGDALEAPDPSFPSRLVVGKVVAVVPSLGLVLDNLRRPLGLAITLYVPAMAVIVSEVKRLGAVGSTWHYYLRTS